MGGINILYTIRKYQARDSNGRFTSSAKYQLYRQNLRAEPKENKSLINATTDLESLVDHKDVEPDSRKVIIEKGKKLKAGQQVKVRYDHYFAI